MHNNKFKKIILSVLGVFGLSLLFAKKALAMCPICTVAVGAGIGFSRWLGIDDTITGLWVGGLTVSMITWTLDWLSRKNYNFRYKNEITILGYYLLIVVPLYFMGLIANPANAIFGDWLDKMLLGTILGSLGFWFAAEWYGDLKKKNGGKAYFPFQKVVMPVGTLLILSIIFYFVT